MASRNDRSRSRDRESKSQTPGAVVPIIDISALNGSDTDAIQAVSQEIGRACEEIGFFIVVNHGIASDIVQQAWDQALEFFDLPLEEKKKHITDDEAKYPYGYSVLGGEVLSRGKLLDEATKKTVRYDIGDVKEMMQMGPADQNSGMPARRMPHVPEGFAEAWAAYYEETNKLAHRLLRAAAIALGLEENWFESKMDRHISAMRANNYPDQEGLMVPAGALRCSAHTDYGTVTILKSGGPGLQVSKDRECPVWQDVPFVEEGFVINLGDLMRRWTNDRWSSTLHRVVNPPAQALWGRRLSLAFFHNLNKDAIVEAIPSCITADRPQLYDSIVAGDFLMLKHLASNGKADPGAHLTKRKGL